MTREELRKHTPGPWIMDPNSDLPVAVIMDDEHGVGLAELGERTPENIANARLMAAAPELLAALEGAISYLELVGGVAENDMYAFRAAIAHATRDTP